MNLKKKKILVAPLNWGLGHATRCIPIIKALEKNGFEPIIASDGAALELLKKEFSHLLFFELPSYDVTYAIDGKNFKWKLLSQIPKIVKAIRNERRVVEKIVSNYSIDGIISDNRLGVFSKKVPSVFITHQLNVLSGSTSWFSTKLHLNYIKKFTACWIPDTDKKPNLSGKMGHLNKPLINGIYIGPLSRLTKKVTPKKYDLMVLLSGPEPQRTLLEEKLIEELKQYPKQTLFIKGIVEKEQTIVKKENITFYNFMDSEAIETAFNASEMILCRSGYTTIMDLAKLRKKAFLIPTPGQYEQEYLAKKYKKEGLAPSCRQEVFKIQKLEKINLYRGFDFFTEECNWEELFRFF
uniref:glycosyltransferase n=1 Tax=Flavobacterium sp. TaxID=239 RepID=UPI00404AAA74